MKHFQMEVITNRGCSIRRGNDTVKNKKGYFEDRRPSSNCDPYLVTGKYLKQLLVNIIFIYSFINIINLFL